jgi:aminodeoxyfutalosine deaminase
VQLAELITALPKVELHLHLVGAASVETVLALATAHPDAGVPSDPTELAEFLRFRDLPHFIDVYYAVDRLITAPEDIVELVVGAARDAAASGVRWAEVSVTADSHLRLGIAPEALREALQAGRRRAAAEHGVQLGWIFDIAGDRGAAAAQSTLAFIEQHAPDGTLALGLAGFETVDERRVFVPFFERARAMGLRAAVHAGESTGPETIWAAIRELHADRIGHGTSAMNDPLLVDYLRESQLPIEVCVTSNLRTGVVPSLDRHPVREFLAAGLAVTLSTDDPGMFGTTLNREYELVADIAELDSARIVELARAGVRASFAPNDVKRELQTAIDGVAKPALA